MDFLTGLKSKLGLAPVDDYEDEDYLSDAEEGEEADGTYGSYPEYGRHGGYTYDPDEDEYAGQVVASYDGETFDQPAYSPARSGNVPLVSRTDVKQYLRTVDFGADVVPEAPVTSAADAGSFVVPEAAAEEPRRSSYLTEQRAIDNMPAYRPAYAGGEAGYQAPLGSHAVEAKAASPEVETPSYSAPAPAVIPAPAPASQPTASAPLLGGMFAPDPAGMPAGSVAVQAAPAQPASPQNANATRLPQATAREMIVVKPTSFADVETISNALRARTTVVLALRNTPDDLTRRILDFSFGAAAMTDACVDPVAVKSFAIYFDRPLDEYEFFSLRNLGAL